MKSKKILTNIAAFLLSIFIIAYIIIQLVSGISSDVVCEYATYSSIENTVQATAYIFRNESIINADNSGIVNYTVKESEKVASNQKVATLFQSSDSISIQNEINEIDKKISIFEKSAFETSYLISNVGKIDTKIYSYLNQIKSNVEANSLSNISQIKRELMIDYNKKYLVTNNKTGFDSQLSTLYNKRDNLLAFTSSRGENVITEKSGYFSTMLDGFEEKYTIDKVTSYNVDAFKNLFNENPVKYSDRSIGKVITDFDWYIVCIVKNEDAEGLVEGRNYPLSFMYSASERITAELNRKVTQTDSADTALVFKIDKVYSEFDYTRSQSIKIVKGEKSGIIVPKSAVRMKDGTLGVYILEGSIVEFKKIEIKSKDENYFVCTTFDPNDLTKREYLYKQDRIITSGKDLYEGRIIN